MEQEIRTYINGYFAHQPIFNAKGKVWGYELFYRHDAEAEAALYRDEGAATMEVLANLALCPDTGFKAAKLVLNFSDPSLLECIPKGLNPEKTIIKITDPELPDSTVQEQVAALKNAGFTILIRNFQGRDDHSELYDLAEIFTIDISAVDPEGGKRLIRKNARPSRMFLAEKVESHEQFEQAALAGFTLFQGFFFKRPKTNTIRKITASETLKFKLLEQLNDPDIDFEKLSDTIKMDVSLSLRLLSLLNSPAYGLAATVESVKQAAVYLGMEQLKKWLRVIILTDLKQPDLTLELTKTSLHRARFLELLGKSAQASLQHERLFLLGLFSLLDAMLDMPMHEVIDLLSSLESSMLATLAGEDTRLKLWLQLAESVEKSDWLGTGRNAASLQIDTNNIILNYALAGNWANSVLTNV